jgi:hypothetical protein
MTSTIDQHAHPLDHDIDDPVIVRISPHPPGHAGRGATVALYRAGDDAFPIALGADAGHFEAFTGEGPEASRIGLDDEVTEDAHVFLALGLGGGAPVAAQDEAADRRHVEAAVENPTERLLALLQRERVVAKGAESFLGQFLDEGGGVILGRPEAHTAPHRRDCDGKRHR